MRKISWLLFFALAALGQTQGRRENAITGSGFFINPEGYLLTNLHVVTACQTAIVMVRGTAAPARVLFWDAKNDLAPLKTEHAPAVLTFRDDQRLKLGENTIVAGYPLAGVVSSSMNLTMYRERIGGPGRRFPNDTVHSTSSAGQQRRASS
jgi:S1-C subfamily serine protease